MDITQYIESGVLELYVLGQLPAAEVQEVESNAAEYPEVAAEIGRIERVLEEVAFTTAPPVNPDVLERTLREIDRRKTNGGGTNLPPAAGTAGAPPWLPWLLTVAGLALAAWFWYSGRSTAAELDDTRQELEALRDDCATIGAERAERTEILASLTRPATQAITLNGTDNAPDKRAVVFYNPEAKAAFFTASNLPAPPAGKQYQLWAIDADGPKSLGVLDLDLDDEAILNLDYLPGVAAFAITLEDEGGKPTPDLEELQVIGEVG